MRLAIIAGCVAAALAIAACGKSNSSKTSSSAATTGTSATTTPTGPPGGLPITLTNFRFQPAVIRGAGGHKLTVHLKNTGTVEHNFSVKSLHIDRDLEPGKEATVTLSLPKSGTVQFFCSYHKASYNMVGSINLGGTNAPAAPPPTNTSTGGAGGY